MNLNPYCRLESVTLDIALPRRRFKAPPLTGPRFGQRSQGGLKQRALDNVSLRLEAGDRVALVGANGSGKTTLLRVVAGVYEPTQGRVTRRGRVSSLQPPWSQGRNRSGYESIVAQGLTLGMGMEAVEDRAAEIAAISELGCRLERPIKTYSPGMRARLAFAVNACFEPDIFLVDEWISHLDRGFLEKVERHLQAKSERRGILVLASHKTDLLRRLCATGAVLEAGRLTAVEPIEDALRRA